MRTGFAVGGFLGVPVGGMFSIVPGAYYSQQGTKTHGGDVTLKQFLEAQHVSVATGNADERVERALAKMRAKRKVILSVTHYHVAAEVVERSNLVVTVPRNAARNAPGVQILPVPLKIPAADVRQFWHRRAHKNPANQWLRAMLANLVFE